MSYLQSFPYGSAQSIDGQMVLDATISPPPPPHVSRTAVGRGNWPPQFNRRNTDPSSTPLGSWGYQMPLPAGVFVQANPAARSGSRYPEADSRRQSIPRRYNVGREQLATEFHQGEETVVVMPPPPAAHGQRRRRLRYVREEFPAEFRDQMEAAVSESAEEYEIRTTGASELAIQKLERVETGGGEWKQGYCCTICLEEMGSGEGKAIRIDCKHEFHEICLISWLRKSNCCPLCRFQIPD